MRKLQKKTLITLGLLLSISIMTYGQLNYKTTWVANSGGTLKNHIQMYMIAAAVNPAGISAGVCYWDEGGRGLGVYSTETGDITNFEWNDRNGGTNVGINLKYIYNAGTTSITKRLITNTNKVIKTVTIAGVSASFGQGDVANHLEPHIADSFRLQLGITGVSANEKYVVAAVYQLNKVFVYNTDLNLLRTISIDRAYYATPDTLGNVWVVQGADDNNAPRILEFDTASIATGKRISGLSDPRSIHISKKGQLVVGDNGLNQQVYFYDITGEPHLVETFGQHGGIGAGIPGEVKPDKFNGIVYAGTDSLDNLYVVTDLEGAIIRKFDANRKMIWQKYGLAFVDMADADPYNENDIFSCEERFSMDYTKENGQEQTYKAYTINRKKYPDDGRCHRSVDGGVWIKRIQGKKFMFCGNMYNDFILIYRFNEETDGEIAIPSGVIMPHTRYGTGLYGVWPPDQPIVGSFIWRDKNGDGKMEKSEYETVPYKIGMGNVDDDGNIYTWDFKYFECQGLDEIGNPIYSFKKRVELDVPVPFTSIKKNVYDNRRDIMYITGNGTSLSSSYNVGPVFAAYYNWSKGNRTAAWVTESNMVYGGFAAKGDYLFAAYTQDRNYYSVDVFSSKDGSMVGNLRPPAEMRPFGWIDIPWGSNAAQRTNGEYLVFQEDDLAEKTVIHRWNPYENDNEFPTKPDSLRLDSKTASSITVSFGKATDVTGLSGYFVYVNGVKSNAKTIWNTKHTITGLSPDTSYEIYVSAADYAGHETFSDTITAQTFPVDIIAPSKPTGFTAYNKTIKTIDLKWNSSLDNIGVTGYDLFLNDEKLDFKPTQDTVYSVTGLIPSNEYLFKIVAYDYAGNASDTTSLTVSTSDDKEEPSIPILYATTQRSTSEAAINWKKSTDNSDVAYYNLYNKGELFREKIPAHEYMGVAVTGDYLLNKITGLDANTSYDFTMKAVDLSGNESGLSNMITMKTDSVWSRLLDVEEAYMGIGYSFAYGSNIDISGFLMGSMMRGYMEWTVDLPMDTTYRFVSHYTTEETLVYQMRIDVNGEKMADFTLKRLPNMTWWDFWDDPNYVIIRLKAGKNLIRLTSSSQWAPNLDLIKVMVSKPFVDISSFTLDKNEINAVKNEKIQLNAIITPLDATDQRVNWTSSRKATATVDANGLVTIIDVGTATITATTADGTKSASCKVTVLTDIEDTKVADIVKIYPNPAKDEFFVKLEGGQGADGVDIRLYNSLSSMVMDVNTKSFENDGSLKFSTSDLPNGIYFLQVTMGNKKVETIKIVVSK